MSSNSSSALTFRCSQKSLCHCSSSWYIYWAFNSRLTALTLILQIPLPSYFYILPPSLALSFVKDSTKVFKSIYMGATWRQIVVWSFFFLILYLDCFLLFYACLVLGSFIAISSNSLSFLLKKLSVYFYCVCLSQRCTCGRWRTFLWSLLSPFTFTWVSGIELTRHQDWAANTFPSWAISVQTH